MLIVDCCIFLDSWILYEEEIFKNNIKMIKINEDLVGKIWIIGCLFFLNFLINVLFYKFLGKKRNFRFNLKFLYY